MSTIVVDDDDFGLQDEAPAVTIDLTREPDSPPSLSSRRGQYHGHDTRHISSNHRRAPPSTRRASPLRRSGSNILTNQGVSYIDLTHEQPSPAGYVPSTNFRPDISFAHSFRNDDPSGLSRSHLETLARGRDLLFESAFSHLAMPLEFVSFSMGFNIREHFPGPFGRSHSHVVPLMDVAQFAAAHTAAASMSPMVLRPEPVSLPTRHGFTRSTKGPSVLICPSCNDELAYEPASKAEPDSEHSEPHKRRGSKREREHHFWAVKKCGHVYCRTCFDGRKHASKPADDGGFRRNSRGSTSSAKVYCAVKDCGSEIGSKTAWVGLFL